MSTKNKDVEKTQTKEKVVETEKFKSILGINDKLPEGYVKLEGYITNIDGKPHQVYYNKDVKPQEKERAYIRKEIGATKS